MLPSPSWVVTFCPSIVVVLLLYTLVINWSGRPVGNGVDYPVREGCSKFDFTMEQIEQKKEKRTRMVSVSVCVCLFIYVCVCSNEGYVI